MTSKQRGSTAYLHVKSDFHLPYIFVRILIENVGATSIIDRATKWEHVVARRATRIKMDLLGPAVYFSSLDIF